MPIGKEAQRIQMGLGATMSHKLRGMRLWRRRSNCKPRQEPHRLVQRKDAERNLRPAHARARRAWLEARGCSRPWWASFHCAPEPKARNGRRTDYTDEAKMVTTWKSSSLSRPTNDGGDVCGRKSGNKVGGSRDVATSWGCPGPELGLNCPGVLRIGALITVEHWSLSSLTSRLWLCNLVCRMKMILQYGVRSTPYCNEPAPSFFALTLSVRRYSRDI